MKENYYDILEVNKNASYEIIDKAYKILVKKYHPDLQDDQLKQKYEEKLKLINEAYEVLSNQDKRNQYNKELEQEELLNKERMNFDNESYQQYSNINENQNISHDDNKYNFHDINYYIEQSRKQAQEQQQKYEQEYNTKINNAVNKAYHDAYIQDLKNRGYRIKYKKNFKDYLKDFVSIIIFLIILFILWNIPFVKNYLINLYNENIIIHYIVDIFLNLFKI